jgi:riboflavin synthase
MFTGLIQDIGKIETITQLDGGIRLKIRSDAIASQLNISDSVAINGVCQTVIHHTNHEFDVIAVEETLKKTTFKNLHSSQPVNLELPLRWNDRLGGHLVLGHVDTVASIVDIRKLQDSAVYEISIPESFLQYIVFTGSISIDGVSLTVAELLKSSIRVSIIPHTLEKTIFRYYNVGDTVNLEFDVIGKYIERMTTIGRKPHTGENQSSLSLEDLRNTGF